jgi:hypothetical protein
MRRNMSQEEFQITEEERALILNRRKLNAARVASPVAERKTGETPKDPLLGTNRPKGFSTSLRKRSSKSLEM